MKETDEIRPPAIEVALTVDKSKFRGELIITPMPGVIMRVRMVNVDGNRIPIPTSPLMGLPDSQQKMLEAPTSPHKNGRSSFIYSKKLKDRRDLSSQRIAMLKRIGPRKEVAKALGIAEGTMYRWFNVKKAPKDAIEAMRSLCKKVS